MGAFPLETVPARTLKVGDNIRLEADRFERIASIAFEENQFIVGGPRNVTATALKIRTYEGTEFMVHPGDMVGVKRDPKPATQPCHYPLNVAMALICGGVGVR